MKVLSVEDLIKNKVKVQQSDTKEYSGELLIPRLGGKIKYNLTKRDIRDFLDVVQDDSSSEETAEKAAYNLIYSVCEEPNLKDKELQKQFECEEPTDIVKHIFSDGEMQDITEHLISVTGFRKGSVVEVKEIKN